MPSPAIAIVGRHNSGKTTSIERLIAELVSRGLDVGTIKHHSHVGFDIDYPGKDSYRHRIAGASDTVIAAPGQIARITTVSGEMECSDILESMPGHDIVIVEGYRKSGLPTIEIMRQNNDADARVAEFFLEGAKNGWSIGTDFTQMTRGIAPANEGDETFDQQKQIPKTVQEKFSVNMPDYDDISNKLPTANTVAVISDMASVIEAAKIYDIPAFDLDDTTSLADFVEQHFVRPSLSVVIQAGGESRRMGQSKATIPFAGRPLLCQLVERLHPVADELIVTTNEPEKLTFLTTDFPDLDIKLVSDVYDYRGALPGLFTALEAASHSHVAVVACDMVFASPALIVAEALTMWETGADAVVPVNRHGYEPFHALYRKETCLPAIKKKLATGEKRAQSLYDEINVHEFPHAKVLEVEPMGGCFLNVNTPEELKALEDSVLGGSEDAEPR